MSDRAAQNGVWFVGRWDAAVEDLARALWPKVRAEEVREGLTRLYLGVVSRVPRCPGFNDFEGLAGLSRAHREAQAIGFFCDAEHRKEGVRVFQDGRQVVRRVVEWDEAPVEDPMAWPVGLLSIQLGLQPEDVTEVARPPRPELPLAMEALLRGEEPSRPELRHKALEAFGRSASAPMTEALVRHLRHEDWVTRFHAARSYSRLPRGAGEGERPRLESLLDDEDEGVREAVLEGVCELIPEVSFSDRELHAQIDRVIARGLTDEDEDVRGAAEAAQALRRELLG